MTPVRQALADYLRIRRRLGFKLEGDQRMLENFVGFLEQASAQRITTDLALMWARMPAQAHPHHWRQRLGSPEGSPGTWRRSTLRARSPPRISCAPIGRGWRHTSIRRPRSRR